MDLQRPLIKVYLMLALFTLHVFISS